ncbi:MAG: phosphatidylserine decarboxylase family protein [Kiritimatiellae bacterium]|nr:phosphatidylserine decarboxylase family protein [Kiritimatiellia bacterium]
MPVRVEVLPYLDLVAVAGVVLYAWLRIFGVRCRRSAWSAVGFSLVSGIALCFFFRDPARVTPADPQLIVSGADGVVDTVDVFQEQEYLNTEVKRVTVFLNLHNVHVNRAPISGRVTAVDFRRGKHLAAYLVEASDLNQCNTFLIEGDATRCVVRQLVGAVVRRVVGWVDFGDTVERGQRLGMMKFGSRLDVLLPAEDVEVLVKEGDRVVAGVTPIARLLEE